MTINSGFSHEDTIVIFHLIPSGFFHLRGLRELCPGTGGLGKGRCAWPTAAARGASRGWLGSYWNDPG